MRAWEGSGYFASSFSSPQARCLLSALLRLALSVPTGCYTWVQGALEMLHLLCFTAAIAAGIFLFAALQSLQMGPLHVGRRLATSTPRMMGQVREVGTCGWLAVHGHQ